MVHQEARKRKTVKAKNLDVVKLVTLGLLIAITTFAVFFFVGYFGQENAEEVQNEEIPVAEDYSATEENTPVKIDFQTIIDDWVATVGGNKSILIYDLERDEIAGEYNTSESYNTASLYKLFVVYEGYLRVQAGEWNGDATVGSTGYTTLECLDLAIRESYSPCAEAMWAQIGHAELDQIITDKFGILNSDISGLESNAEDIAAMMKIFYEHTELTDENLIAQMKDSFLNQPETTYDWRQGLPSGFSKAQVYNKVGWDYNLSGYWNVYHDVAIVEFPEDDRHFVVVVMTNQVDYEQIRAFGTELENYYYGV